MPSKKEIKEAERRGTNPMAVAHAMANRGEIPKSKVEETAKEITRSVLHSDKKKK